MHALMSQRWFFCFTLVLAVPVCLEAAPEPPVLPLVIGVELQPLTAQVRRVTEALESLGAPLSESDRRALDSAFAMSDAELAQTKNNTSGEDALNSATQQILQQLQQGNPNMKVTRQPARVRLNGQPGLATYLSNDSPVGGQETDWVITTMRPEGVVYFVCVAPQSAFDKYDKTFTAILDSVRFSK